MKAMPLGYNPRHPGGQAAALRLAAASTFDSLRLVHRMIETAEWRTARMADSVHGDFSTATDLANFLAESGNALPRGPRGRGTGRARLPGPRPRRWRTSRPSPCARSPRRFPLACWRCSPPRAPSAAASRSAVPGPNAMARATRPRAAPLGRARLRPRRVAHNRRHARLPLDGRLRGRAAPGRRASRLGPGRLRGVGGPGRLPDGGRRAARGAAPSASGACRTPPRCSRTARSWRATRESGTPSTSPCPEAGSS